MPRPSYPSTIFPCEAAGGVALQIVYFERYKYNKILAIAKLYDDDAVSGRFSFTPAQYMCAYDAEKLTPPEIWSQIKDVHPPKKLWNQLVHRPRQGSSNVVIELQPSARKEMVIPTRPPSRFDFDDERADTWTNWLSALIGFLLACCIS